MLKNILKATNQQTLVAQQLRGLKTAVRREINFDFENERKAYQKKVKEVRKQHKKDYWDMQTQVENKYLEQHKQQRITKLTDDMIRWRTQICNISWMTDKKIKYLQERENRILGIMHFKDIGENRRKLTNRYMLDAMQLESRRWPKLGDLDNSVTSQFLLPQTVLNYTEYQDKLQRLAFYAEQGDNEAMQSILNKEEAMEKKNSFLQPLFRDIKTKIRHMTYTPEYKILREYVKTRRQIEAKYGTSSRAKHDLKELNELYASLLRNQRLRMRANSGYKLKQMQKRLEDMFGLLSLWQQYVDIIYAPEQEINLLKAMKDTGTLGADLSESNFAARLENANIEKKLAELFATDTSAALDDELDDMASKNAEDAYMSVQEGLTSDTSITSEGPDFDF